MMKLDRVNIGQIAQEKKNNQNQTLNIDKYTEEKENERERERLVDDYDALLKLTFSLRHGC